MTNENDVDNLKKVIITIASHHYGISGNIVLDDAGDRINADYDIRSDKIKLRRRSVYLEA